jgi:hypothetical protein
VPGSLLLQAITAVVGVTPCTYGPRKDRFDATTPLSTERPAEMTVSSPAARSTDLNRSIA